MKNLKSLRFFSSDEFLLIATAFNFDLIFETSIKHDFSDNNMSDFIESTKDLDKDYFLELLIDDNYLVHSLAFVSIEDPSYNDGFNIVNVSELMSGVKGSGKYLLSKLTKEFSKYNYFISLTPVNDDVQHYYTKCDFVEFRGNMFYVPGHTSLTSNGLKISIENGGNMNNFISIKFDEVFTICLDATVEGYDINRSEFPKDRELDVLLKYLPYIEAALLFKIVQV